MSAGGGRGLRQLLDGDSVFVAMETSEAPSHIGGLTILDPSTHPSFGFERFLDVLRDRIELVPRFKWKLWEVPLGLDRAYWVEDPGFDVRRHVSRIALPAPHDRSVLARVAGMLHGQSLDRTRPLWECWWIEGLEGGRVAMLMKVHHCLMDGQSGIGLTEVLMDLSPEPEAGSPLAAAAEEQALRSPGLLEVGRRAIENGLYRQGRMALHAARAARDGLLGLLDPSDEAERTPLPRVSFNRRLSRDRSFAFTTLPLAPLRDAKKHFDVKLNDVLLSLVGSTLRRGLRQQGELPDDSLVAICPVSLRQEGDQSFGNQISSMPVTLGTDVEDPIDRLKRIADDALQSKRRMRQGAFEVISALGESLVPAAVRYTMRAAHAISEHFPLPGNLVVSNVRGLPFATYMAGARVEELYPMSMLQVAHGMNVTAVSHDDQVDFGFLVDPQLVPDPWLYAEGVETAMSELDQAVSSVTRAALERSMEAIRSREASETAESDAGESPGVDPAPPPPPEADPLDLSLLMAGLNGAAAPRRPRSRAERDGTEPPRGVPRSEASPGGAD